MRPNGAAGPVLRPLGGPRRGLSGIIRQFLLEGSGDHRVEPLTPTLKLIVRERVRTLDLATGQPVCSLVSLRAGPITHAVPRVPRGGTKVPKVVAHGGPALGRYSTLKLWRRASLERLCSARSRTLRSGNHRC